MLPLDLSGSFLVLRGREAFRQGDVLLFVEGGPAVERDPVVIIDLPLQRLLGLVERVVPNVARGLRPACHEQYRQHSGEDMFAHTDTSRRCPYGI